MIMGKFTLAIPYTSYDSVPAGLALPMIGSLQI